MRPEPHGKGSGSASWGSREGLEGQRISGVGRAGQAGREERCRDWGGQSPCGHRASLAGTASPASEEEERTHKRGPQEHLGVRIISAIVGNTSPGPLPAGGGRGCCEGSEGAGTEGTAVITVSTVSERCVQREPRSRTESPESVSPCGTLREPVQTPGDPDCQSCASPWLLPSPG